MIKQQHVAAVLAEFIGTLTLALVVLSTSLYRFPLFTAMAAGITVIVFTSVFGKISGGHFNPAITVSLFAIRQINAVKAVAYIVFQFLAGFAAWQVYEYFTGQPLTNGASHFDAKIFIAEAAGAFIFGVAFAAVITQKIQGYQAAAAIGGGLFLGLMVAGLASSGILNPAVAIATHSFDVNYGLGPVVGALVGMALTALVIVPIFGVKKVDNISTKPAVTAKATVSAGTTSTSKTAKAPAKKATATKSKKTAKKTTSK